MVFKQTPGGGGVYICFRQTELPLQLWHWLRSSDFPVSHINYMDWSFRSLQRRCFSLRPNKIIYIPRYIVISVDNPIPLSEAISVPLIEETHKYLIGTEEVSALYRSPVDVIPVRVQALISEVFFCSGFCAFFSQLIRHNEEIANIIPV